MLGRAMNIPMMGTTEDARWDGVWSVVAMQHKSNGEGREAPETGVDLGARFVGVAETGAGLLEFVLEVGDLAAELLDLGESSGLWGRLDGHCALCFVLCALLAFVGGELAGWGDLVGGHGGGRFDVRRAADGEAASLGDAGDGDAVGLVSADDVVGLGVFGDVEGDVAAGAAGKDEDVTKHGGLGGDAVAGPVASPERGFDDFEGTLHAAVADDGGKEPTPWDVVIGEAADGDAGLVEFVPPGDDGAIAAGADDFGGAMLGNGEANGLWQTAEFGEPVILGRERGLHRVQWWPSQAMRERMKMRRRSERRTLRSPPVSSCWWLKSMGAEEVISDQ